MKFLIADFYRFVVRGYRPRGWRCRFECSNDVKRVVTPWRNDIMDPL